MNIQLKDIESAKQNEPILRYIVYIHQTKQKAQFRDLWLIYTRQTIAVLVHYWFCNVIATRLLK